MLMLKEEENTRNNLRNKMKALEETTRNINKVIRIKRNGIETI